ncbi:MAG TPA: XdhC family protein [Candidatus Baltobacteraceae bacterium]|nr:XdhC family protein [Candidatus Baltobacteraceae bacterium]
MTNVLARAVELDAAGLPFAMATVVAVQRPTSARPGARGLIHPDGTIEGWVGGSCAQPVVVREALRSLVDGEPRLIRLSRTGGEGRRGDGVIEYVMTCHSGGTLEIFVQPHLPPAELWVIGATPIAQALARAGVAAGYHVSVVDPVADPEVFGEGIDVHPDMDLAGLAPVSAPYVVVASQGGWDEEALEAVLGRDVAYVGLIASPTRATAVRAYLHDANVTDERLGALRAPAGLDLGAQTPAEIAISILAELVQVRRGRAPFVAAPGPAAVAGAHAAPAPATDAAASDAVDPVCGMDVEIATARHLAQYEGTLYYFCSVGCRARFMRDPASYVGAGMSTAAESE